MAVYDVDFFVIGGGSGGVRAGRIAAQHGAKVAIAEASRWGGTCVIRGCVPKKLLVFAAEISRTLEDAGGQGWTIGPGTFDWPTLIAGKDREIARLSGLYAANLAKAGAEVIDGRATLVDPHTVEVNGRKLTAAHILIATGGTALKPAAGEWITSDDAFHLPALPGRIAVLGAGYIGVEFAHIFAGLGSKVTLIHRESRVLRGFDDDVRTEVELGLARHGIELVEGTSLQCGKAPDGGIRLTIGARAIDVDVAMAAVGRAPAVAGLGLEAAGVALDARGAIAVDEWSRTNVPHIYAVGDVTGRVALTPIAIREGHAVADTLFGNRPTAIKHHLIPTAVFSQPPAAAVGLSEAGARAAGHDAQIFKARFKPMRYALSKREEHVMIKLVVDRATDRVLGLHMVGVDAPEIVQAAAIAITMGATKADFDHTFALHPTTAEELVLLR